MPDDTFKITEESRQQLIVDLLVRVTVENQVQRAILFGALSGGNPQKFEETMATFRSQFAEKSLQLKEIIFANYGHIDIGSLLNGETL